MTDWLDDFYRSLLRPGMEVTLRAELSFTGGTYRIITISDNTVKVRRGKGDAIVLTRKKFDSLLVGYMAGPGGTNEGVLSILGYHVGRDGLSEGTRRHLLVSVLLREHLPPVPNVAEWGLPRSSQRVLKLAKCLAAFARNAQNRRDSPQEAIDDWKADLEWLRESLQGPFGLTWWPET